MSLKVPRCLPLCVFFVLFSTQSPVAAQSIPCSAITRNPLVLEAVLDSHSKDSDAGLQQDDTINADQLAHLRLSPIVIQPGTALCIDYRRCDLTVNADLTSGMRWGLG